MKLVYLVSLVGVALLLGVPAIAFAEREFPASIALEFKVKDLVLRVEDLGGAVQDLKIKESPTELKIELSGDVLFDFDRWDIRGEAEPVLKNVGEIIGKYPKANVQIDGYTDSKGQDDYNMRLSQRRADSVRGWLVAHADIANNRFHARGLGEQNPVAPNAAADGSDDPAGRQKNRRVEITVKK